MSTIAFKGHKYTRNSDFPVEDMLTVEESLKITINGAPFTVTMRSPGSEMELVRGLLYTEDIYKDIDVDPIISVREKVRPDISPGLM